MGDSASSTNDSTSQVESCTLSWTSRSSLIVVRLAQCGHLSVEHFEFTLDVLQVAERGQVGDID